MLEDDFWWKTTFGGRQPSVEDDLQWILACCLLRFAAFFLGGGEKCEGEKFNSIQFYLILFYSILFYSILFFLYFILSYSILFYIIFSNSRLPSFLIYCGICKNRKWNYWVVFILPHVFVSCSWTLVEVRHTVFCLK